MKLTAPTVHRQAAGSASAMDAAPTDVAAGAMRRESGLGPHEAAASSTEDPTDLLPDSVNLPSRPVLGGRLDYPYASPLEIVDAGGAYTTGALWKVSK